MGVAGRIDGAQVAGMFRPTLGSGGIVASGQISLNFASIAAGATAVATATVTGALTTDDVIATAPRLEETGPTLIEDLVLVSARVSAANTVEIRLKNTHASVAKDALAANFGIIILRT